MILRTVSSPITIPVLQPEAQVPITPSVVSLPATFESASAIIITVVIAHLRRNSCDAHIVHALGQPLSLSASRATRSRGFVLNTGNMTRRILAGVCVCDYVVGMPANSRPRTYASKLLLLQLRASMPLIKRVRGGVSTWTVGSCGASSR